MIWHKIVHTGWRRGLGFALILFGLLSGSFYYMELNTIGAAIRNTDKAVSDPTARPITPTTNASANPSPPPINSASTISAKIKLSTATQAELESLPSIGPAKAKAILEYRALHGFKSVNDLDKVKGIGPKTLELLRPLIEL